MSMFSWSNSLSMKIRGFEIKNIDSEKLLGVKFYELNFDSHIPGLNKNPSCRINGLQAFTNCVHGYDGARNVYTNGVTRARY